MAGGLLAVLLDQAYTVADVTGSGGVEVGGSADVQFIHGGQVASDIVVEWDMDNDGDFDEDVEDITAYVLNLSTLTGRDWPSQLTGRAGPGTLRATLNNDDDRFSYFNTASPLNTDPFALKTGRKIRVRTSGASSPDPVLLARDRFRRSDGALGDAETGGTWSQPLTDDFAIADQRAVATTQGDGSDHHIAVLDVGVADYYVQATLAEISVPSTVGVTGGRVGIIYRYVDTDNYSFVASTEQIITLYDVVSGVRTPIAVSVAPSYRGVTLGALLADDAVTIYVDGAPVYTDTAIQTSATKVGIYAEWGDNNRRPAIAEFAVWDRVWAPTDGILWTGELVEVRSSVAAGQPKRASLVAQGSLSKLAGLRTTPPQVVPVWYLNDTRPTGLLVGNALAQAGMVHPPGVIDEGDVEVGPFGMDEVDMLTAIRRFEEAEFGFLYEMQEGPVGYAGRSARTGVTSSVTFTDDPAGQFGYQTLEPADWRREIFNRVVVEVASGSPSGVSVTNRTMTNLGASNDLTVEMPSTVAAGDLLLVFIAAGAPGGLDEWVVPEGWVHITDRKPIGYAVAPADPDDSRVFARIADGSEDSASVTFGFDSNGSNNGAVSAVVVRVTDWFGSIEDGIHLGDFVSGSAGNTVFPPWGNAPALVLGARFGTRGSGTVTNPTAPLGYMPENSGNYADGAGGDAAVQVASTLVANSVESAGQWGATFSGFDVIENVLVAVRGPNPDADGNPIARGHRQVVVDDFDSQDEHNLIRTYTTDFPLFHDATDADTLADLVIARYADDRPIVTLGFCPVKSVGYRAQAIRRRVSDKVTLVATGNAGMGISADFFIESIEHRWSQGTTLWETTWQLSPA